MDTAQLTRVEGMELKGEGGGGLRKSEGEV